MSQLVTFTMIGGLRIAIDAQLIGGVSSLTPGIMDGGELLAEGSLLYLTQPLTHGDTILNAIPVDQPMEETLTMIHAARGGSA